MISMLYTIYCTQDSQLLFPTAKSANNAPRVNDSPVVREMVMSRAFYLCLKHTQKKHWPIYGFFRHGEHLVLPNRARVIYHWFRLQ